VEGMPTKEAKKQREVEGGPGMYTVLDDKRVENFKKDRGVMIMTIKCIRKIKEVKKLKNNLSDLPVRMAAVTLW